MATKVPGMYFAIRVAVGSAIMIAFYLTRGFGSLLETFVMAFAASVAAQGVALGVKLAVGDAPRSGRAALLLGASVIAVAASVVFVAVDKHGPAVVQGVHGYLDLSTLKRTGDVSELTIEEHGKRTKIRYRGVLSDQLRDRNEIVAKGKWQGDVFVANDVMAKCPTSYPVPTGSAAPMTYR